MTLKSFTDGINLITQTFGETPVKGPRLERIKALCFDKVDDAGFIEICTFICDTHRHPPLPSDFDKCVIEWRKRFYDINGYKYGDFSKQDFDAFKEKLTENGLSETLKTLNSNSLWDAIEKTKGQ